MRFAIHQQSTATGIAVASKDTWFDAAALDLPFEITAGNIASLSAERLSTLRAAVASTTASALDFGALRLLPPIAPDSRIFCVGLNYSDHANESNMEKPAYPVIFLRTYASFVGSGVPLTLPKRSEAFDYEGEMVAVLSRGGRHLDIAAASECVGGYSVANEGSIRDYQLKRGPQWTMGKNFHASGSMGPCLVTADELPAIGKGLDIATRLNGEVVQHSNTSNMIFDLAQIISYLSEGIVLRAGDVIVSGTPAGVGAARVPPLFMKAGDLVEVEVEHIGCVSNRVVAE